MIPIDHSSNPSVVYDVGSFSTNKKLHGPDFNASVAKHYLVDLSPWDPFGSFSTVLIVLSFVAPVLLMKPTKT